MIHPRTLNALEFGKIIEHMAGLCVSAIGRELALEIRPLGAAEEAEAALALYEQYRVWAAQGSASGRKFTLADFPDVRNLLSRFEKSFGDAKAAHARLDIEDFWGLREMLRLARKTRESIISPAAPREWPRLLELAEAAPLPAQLAAALDRCISDDALLRDESSPELYRLRGEMRSLHQNCLRRVKDFAKRYNIAPYLQDDFITLSSDRYVLPLKANFKGRIQGVIHDWSQTGETCYFEPIFLVEINNRLRELKREEREEEQKILVYLAGLLDAEFAGAKAALELLAAIDILQAKSRMADALGCQSASFTPEDQGIELLGARHPLLLMASLNKKGQNARPLDIILRAGEKVLVVSGGNAGGKTVCLKTLGLSAAMLMSGLPAPLEKGSHLPWFDRMDAFIGDEQSIADNASTFTAQIDHLAKAWKYLDSRGLVLLDEFGAGTDPAEGSALAQALLDELLRKQCFVLAATHFPALKTYALSREGARAASMLFDPASNRPLFKLAYDQVGASQALLVAAEHGLPESILQKARHYLLQDGQDSSRLIDRLNALAVEREGEIEKLRAEERKTQNALAEGREKLDRERRRLQNEVGEKIRELMRAWKAERASAKQALKEMSGLRAGLFGEKETDESILPRADNFAVGREVFHTVFNKRGIVRDIDERRQKVRLDMSGVAMWADMKDLRQTALDGRAALPKAAKSPILAPASPAAISLDVRGKRAEEALAEVEAFLDRALLAGFSEVEVIHGRGTGALRKQIHEFLRSFPPVESFTLAPEDRGGDGMTIARFA